VGLKKKGFFNKSVNKIEIFNSSVNNKEITKTNILKNNIDRTLPNDKSTDNPKIINIIKKQRSKEENFDDEIGVNDLLSKDKKSIKQVGIIKEINNNEDKGRDDQTKNQTIKNENIDIEKEIILTKAIIKKERFRRYIECCRVVCDKKIRRFEKDMPYLEVKEIDEIMPKVQKMIDYIEITTNYSCDVDRFDFDFESNLDYENIEELFVKFLKEEKKTIK